MWTKKKLIRVAKATPGVWHRPVSARYDWPCAIVRVTPTGRVREGVDIYEDGSIRRNDVPIGSSLLMRPQDAAKLLGLKE